MELKRSIQIYEALSLNQSLWNEVINRSIHASEREERGNYEAEL